MKYKKYFRKTSFKQKGVGDFFLNLVTSKKPKTFLEVGVFHGVTARNVCELLYSLHKNEFKYIGLDLFEKNSENENEAIPSTNFANPLKDFYYKYIKKQDPYSIEAVKELLIKYENNVHLIKGNSNKVLKNIDMKKIEFVFLDGGHTYETVMNDLEACHDTLNYGGTVLCDDYNLGHSPGVKNSIDDYVRKNNLKCTILCDGRFAKIETE